MVICFHTMNPVLTPVGNEQSFMQMLVFKPSLKIRLSKGSLLGCRLQAKPVKVLKNFKAKGCFQFTKK